MNTSVVDRMLDVYIAVGDAAIQAIRPEVMYVFISLCIIGLTWAHLRNAITQRESPINLLIVQFMGAGFFVWLLDNWGSLMNALMGGMVQLGLKAGGNIMTADQFIHPSQIVAVGIQILTPLIDAVGFWGWMTGTNIILVFSMLLTILAYFVLSLQVLVAIIEFKLGVVWSFFMTALGIFKGTSFASEKALGYVFSSGIKLFAVATIVSVGSALMLTFGTFADPSAPTYGEALGMAFGSIVLAALAWFIPAKAAGVISGGPSLGAGAAVGTLAAVGATAAVAGVGAVAAAKAASAGSSALKSAVSGSGASRGGLGSPPSNGPGGGPAGGPGGSSGGPAGRGGQPATSPSAAASSISEQARKLPKGQGDGAQAPTQQQWQDAKIMGTDITAMTRSQAGAALEAHQKWFENRQTGSATGETSKGAEKSATTQPAKSQPPAWANNSRYTGPISLMKVPSNLNAMVPRGADRSAGMNANNTGAQE